MSVVVRKLALPLLIAGGAFPLAAQAATITGWNTGNVAVGPVVADGETGFSVVYDRAPLALGAVTNGRIAYTAPEANSPGMMADPTPFSSAGQVKSGCIRASSTTTCDGDFQSGKRFKEQLTGLGAVDLVFDVDPQGVQPTDSVGYQVFHRLVNLTGQRIGEFSIELGFGVGDGFTRSSAADGVSFSTTFQSGPDDANAFSQFPFGLFGDASTNPNFTLDGFFASERSGIALSMGEDVIAGSGVTGPYASLFGDWMSQDMAPEGLFWDNDGDASTDAILMAWLNQDGLWEVRRDVDPNDQFSAVSAAAQVLGTDYTAVETLLGVSLEKGIIEDLANLNVNYAINLGGQVNFSDFTLRVVSVPAAIPLPMSGPLLLGALGLMGFVRRRRRAATAT
ncbi:MAG: choice-of-anchor F family protein [Rhodobacteraceae bacterium]|nr:choice-of-anchor F family protein [Paracoccaceae bacterium]